MKRFYLAAALLGLVCSVAPAQGKLSLADKAMLNELRLPQNMSGSEFIKNTRSVTVGDAAAVSAIVEVAAGYSVEDLTAAGAVVSAVSGNFAIVNVPLDMVEAFASEPSVKKMQLDRQAELTNDRARSQAKVHQVHAGMGLGGSKYTGTGVIAGIYDQGVDPHHPAFLTADKSASRIKRLFLTSDTKDGVTIRTYSGTGDTQTAAGDPISDLGLFTTDTNESSHGTHTSATVAGGKAGSTTYYGMAPDADIAIGCGSASLSAIVSGISAIANYGLEVNKPVVVNCSMGINSGTHDGTDLFSRMIDQIVDETNAIVSFSAGNEGDAKIGWHHAFDKTEACTTAFKESVRNGLFYGTTEFVGNTADPFKVTIVMADVKTGKIVETLASTEQSKGGFIYFATPGALNDNVKYNTSTTIDKYWTSAYFGIGSEVNEDNGRYYVLIQYGFGTSASALRDEEFRYVPAFIVEGKAGQEVWGYCSGRYETLSSRGIASWKDGTPNGSISNIACAKNVISVGAYVSRNSYKTVGGETLANRNKTGDIASFSSYGDIPDGRSLPTVCAPGSFLLSAISYPYWISNYNKDDNNNPIYTRETSAQYEAVNGRVNAYCDMQGTSMSCPVVTGTMALWKQAYPGLTVQEAKEIIAETAVKPVIAEGVDPTQWGAGKLDAMAGLKKVLEKGSAGVDALEPDARLIVTQVGPKVFEVFVSGETSLRATMFNMSGVAVMSEAIDGDTLTMDASSVAPGVYVVSVEGSTTHYSQRVLIK